MAEFTTPDFLDHHSPEEVFERMKTILPKDIDLSEGGHAWNMTMPTALVVSELAEFILPEVIQLIFPAYSYGAFLDSHAKDRGITRRAAGAATGEITITGEANMVIPAGSLFSTAAVNGEPSVDYRTTEVATIPESGSVSVAIECTQPGIIGNTQAGTIILVSSRLSGITSVTNEAAVSGGTEEEDDEALIERISEYDRSHGESYVGSVADYKRWALSVSGVGNATVLSAQDTSGLVTIIVTDANGDPATQQICESVYNYIMRPDAPEERLAPVNAFLSVVPPSTIAIGIKATVELEEDATIEAVRAAFLANLALYLPEALEDKEVKYSRVWAILSATEGVNDFSGLQIGEKTDGVVTYGTSNIAITTSELPTVATDDLNLTAGTV